MSQDTPALPLPHPTALTLPFWKAARAQHRLQVQRCSDCGRLRFYPSAGCDRCASMAFTWVSVSGRGRVYSWIVVRRSADPAWRARIPYVSAIVELPEQAGLLMPGLLTGIAPEQVRAELPVEVWFEDMNNNIAMPRWRPHREQG